MNPLTCHWLSAEMSEAELQELATVAIYRAVPDGEQLFAMGDRTPGLHIVEEGAVKIYTITQMGEERIIDILGPGDCCGEMGVVDRAPAAAWGQALGDTRLWIIPPDVFERLLLAHPATCVHLCRMLVGKLRTASAQLDEAIFLKSRERVLRALTRLVERHGKPVPAQGFTLPIRLTHQEIARLAGTARETVSRVLGELQDRHLLRFAGGHMQFPDMRSLEEMAGLVIDRQG